MGMREYSSPCSSLRNEQIKQAMNSTQSVDIQSRESLKKKEKEKLIKWKKEVEVMENEKENSRHQRRREEEEVEKRDKDTEKLERTKHFTNTHQLNSTLITASRFP